MGADVGEEPRRARLAVAASDFGRAAELLVSFSTEYDEPAPDPVWWAGHLQRLVAEGTARVTLVGDPGDGVGVVRLRTSTYAEALEAYLAELYVVPGLRGQGLGTVLLQAVIDDARAQGATYMDLTTTEDDVAARAIYERFGFDRNEGKGLDGSLSFYYEKEL